MGTERISTDKSASVYQRFRPTFDVQAGSRVTITISFCKSNRNHA